MIFQKLQSCYQRIPHEHIKLIRSLEIHFLIARSIGIGIVIEPILRMFIIGIKSQLDLRFLKNSISVILIYAN